ncbi:hypothetical protein HJC23_007103 [Cyclotella cryptica]|uniref:SLC41A/MgtE integral membrane domain-containing protein n=1 Tax=Cyclotella cryptica TaxID=29204 RepID=A0ABD3P1E0_9STRA
MKSRASEVAKPNDTESELHLLRQQNKELQTQLKELRLHVESLNGKTLNESNRIRSPSLSNNDTFCLQNGRVSTKRIFRAKRETVLRRRYRPLLRPLKRTTVQTLRARKPQTTISKLVSSLQVLLRREQVPTSDVSGFSTPKQSNKKSAYESSSKDSTDRGGNYKKVFNMDEEHGSHSPESNEGTEDECDELIHDDSSHNKHQNRRSQRRARHTETFRQQVKERAGWLIGLLFLQSCSSFIIQYNERFLQSHMVIVQFLTMLVGAGGNAGNQASVRVIRGLAVGTLNDRTLRPFLKEEIKMAFGLSALLGLTGFIRAALFRTPPGDDCSHGEFVCHRGN